MNNECPSYPVTIYVAGDLTTAKQVCRTFCYRIGLCVFIHGGDYIYTGGEEAGVSVGLINYPRFPAEPAAIREKAFNLANCLRATLCQHSWTVETPENTYYNSLRETNGLTIAVPRA